ncbi:MAG: HAD family phosphatase [Bacteroidetes bacterium]|nr:HAD family phosphatase [Bacteroidota bacterium]
MKDIEFILFDLGNVLIRIDILNFPRNLGITEPSLLTSVHSKIHPLQQLYESGKIPTDVFFGQVAEILQNSFSRDVIEQAFSSILCEPIDAMENVVRSLSQSYYTALVSNTSEFHYRRSLLSVPALRYLKKHYVSYQLNALKPQREFYDIVVADLKCSPESVLFIDDTACNVEGAIQAGMHGIQFTSVEQLLKDFESFNIQV